MRAPWIIHRRNEPSRDGLHAEHRAMRHVSNLPRTALKPVIKGGFSLKDVSIQIFAIS